MNYFEFKQFRINQEKSAFKVGTDGVLLGAWADVANARRILDIGAGTGLISLMIAQRSGAQIIAIEPDKPSFTEAEANIRNSPWHDRISLINTSLQDYCASGKFDLIVSNPPYFRDSLLNEDERISKARHSLNLTSKDIISSSRKMLDESGRLVIILPYAEAAMFIAEAATEGLYCNKLLKIKPLPSAPVKRMIMELELIKKDLKQSFLTIEKGPRHSYTEDYRSLTSDYYLKF